LLEYHLLISGSGQLNLGIRGCSAVRGAPAAVAFGRVAPDYAPTLKTAITVRNNRITELLGINIQCFKPFKKQQGDRKSGPPQKAGPTAPLKKRRRPTGIHRPVPNMAEKEPKMKTRGLPRCSKAREVVVAHVMRLHVYFNEYGAGVRRTRRAPDRTARSNPAHRSSAGPPILIRHEIVEVHTQLACSELRERHSSHIVSPKIRSWAKGRTQNRRTQ